MAQNYFSPKENDECLPNFEIFGENKFLETNDNLHNDQLSLFIEGTWNVNTYDKKRKTYLKVLTRWYKSVKEALGSLKKFLSRNLTTFYVISKSVSKEASYKSSFTFLLFSDWVE